MHKILRPFDLQRQEIIGLCRLLFYQILGDE